MKKSKSILRVTMTLVALVIMFALGVFSVKAYEYIVWRGTLQVENMNTNLDRVQLIINNKNEVIEKLEKELEDIDSDTEYYENYVSELVKEIELRDRLIEDRDNSIEELQEDVLARDKIIEELSVILEQVEKENEQAYEDVKMLDNKLEKILEEVK